jgi:hypothetical protein
MSKNKSNSRGAARQRASKRRQQKRLIQLVVMVIAGVALIAAGWYIFAGRNSAQAAIDYGPEDVVSDSPLHAVHEMEPSNLASIPFLPKNSPQPKIAILEDFYSFGSVGATEVVQHEFAIANVGDAPLTISRAYTTCGCTTADFTATVIPPGKVSIMTLTFDAGFHDARGQTVRRGVIIENNDPRNPQVEIWTQAAVRTTP